MKVFITGGSGYIGRATITALLGAGHTVSALVRSDEAEHAVAALGAATKRGGLDDLSTLTAAAAGADAVIHLAQARSADTAEIDAAAAQALQQGAGSRPYVHTGGVWIYGDTDGEVDEDAPFAPPPIVAWRLANEAAVLGTAQSGGHPVLVMPGVVYGDAQGLIENLMLAGAAQAGAVPYIGDGSQHWPLVHVEDIASLYVLALGGAAGSRYAGVSTSALTMGEIAEAVSHAAGIPGATTSVSLEQARVTMGGVADAFAQDQQVSGARARRELGWAPVHIDPLAELAAGQ